MTRKDYVAIAAAINHAAQRAEAETGTVRGADIAAEEIASVMANDNARFNRARFLKACGVQS